MHAKRELGFAGRQAAHTTRCRRTLVSRLDDREYAAPAIRYCTRCAGTKPRILRLSNDPQPAGTGRHEPQHALDVRTPKRGRGHALM